MMLQHPSSIRDSPERTQQLVRGHVSDLSQDEISVGGVLETIHTGNADPGEGGLEEPCDAPNLIPTAEQRAAWEEDVSHQ